MLLIFLLHVVSRSSVLLIHLSSVFFHSPLEEEGTRPHQEEALHYRSQKNVCEKSKGKGTAEN